MLRDAPKMWDLIVLAISIISFALLYAYTLACDRL